MSVVEEGEGGGKLMFAAKGQFIIWRTPVRALPMSSQLKVRGRVGVVGFAFVR